MPAGAAFEVIGHGPLTDTLEISLDDDAIVVWGWTGSVLSLFHGATELGDARRRPAVPRGPNRGQAPLASPAETR